MRSTFLYSSVLPRLAAKEPAIAVRIAQTWLVVGCVAVLCVPALRDRSEWLGWLPLWFVIVPAAQLVILRWRALFAFTNNTLSQLRRHRARPVPRRARRQRKSVASRQMTGRSGALLAAFLLR